IMGIHQNTLRSYLQKNNISYRYNTISDANLDRIVQAFRQKKPDSGIRYLAGHLRQQGLRIQKR
ncbi:hypothetical protein M405DRAFT_720543, partial [Rhizopogon salebrosus TDB-379]